MSTLDSGLQYCPRSPWRLTIVNERTPTGRRSYLELVSYEATNYGQSRWSGCLLGPERQGDATYALG